MQGENHFLAGDGDFPGSLDDALPLIGLMPRK